MPVSYGGRSTSILSDYVSLQLIMMTVWAFAALFASEGRRARFMHPLVAAMVDCALALSLLVLVIVAHVNDNGVSREWGHKVVIVGLAFCYSTWYVIILLTLQDGTHIILL